MIKKLLFSLFLPLLTIIFISNANLSIDVKANDNVNDLYKVINDNEYFHEREYLTDELSPDINIEFIAPSEYNFLLSFSDEKYEKFKEEIDACNPNYGYYHMIYRYSINGSKVSSDSDPDYNDSREEFYNDILNFTNNFSLFTVKDLAVQATIQLNMDAVFYDNSGKEYIFHINSSPIVVEPYDEFDFIKIIPHYFYDPYSNDVRITLVANAVPGFFDDDYYMQNPTGFHLDETPIITFFAYDSIPLSSGSNFKEDLSPIYQGTLEMSFPSTPMPVKAMVTFKSGGIEYTYYSKTIIIGDPNLSMSIDEDCDVISRDINHSFSLHMPDYFYKTICNDYSTINVRMMPLLLNDSDYIHYLFSNPQLPQIGIDNHLYYIPTQEEINAYNNNEEVYPDGIQNGQFYIWHDSTNSFEEYYGENISILYGTTLSNDVHYLFDNQILPSNIDDCIINEYGSIYYIPTQEEINALKPVDFHLYYVPTIEEINAYNNNEEIYPDGLFRGIFYRWSEMDEKFFVTYENCVVPAYTSDDGSIFLGNLNIPYAGNWSIDVLMNGGSDAFWYYINQLNVSTVKVVATDDSNYHIDLNVSDNVNLIQNASNVIIDVNVGVKNDDVEIPTKYFYNYSISDENKIDVSLDDGKLIIIPKATGVTKLTIEVESSLFSNITKTIEVRVLDNNIYDVAKIVVPDEFHYSGNDLEINIEIRGITKFSNLDIEWEITDKNGNLLDNSKYIDNKDGSIIITNAEENDYNIKALYQGIEIDSTDVQVRRINANEVIRHNIWWIFLLTISFGIIIIVLRNMLKRSHTTVENIDKAYEFYCNCIADDKLTLLELKRINKDIKKCLHRCEDLNIAAFNQYEKSIRYLRKSYNDAKTLLKEWDNISIEEKNVYYERLDADLSKALSVAKEIESAKRLVDEYHNNANHNNYEKINDDKKSK